jgi:hypothetical protein
MAFIPLFFFLFILLFLLPSLNTWSISKIRIQLSFNTYFPVWPVQAISISHLDYWDSLLLGSQKEPLKMEVRPCLSPLNDDVKSHSKQKSLLAATLRSIKALRDTPQSHQFPGLIPFHSPPSISPVWSSSLSKHHPQVVCSLPQNIIHPNISMFLFSSLFWSSHARLR